MKKKKKKRKKESNMMQNLKSDQHKPCYECTQL